MPSKEPYQIILDGFDGIAYLADLNTHELIYVNKQLQAHIQAKGIEDYRQKKCYEALQGLKEPCPFCTNSILAENKICNWERYHPQIKRFFELKDSVVELDGKKLRLEFGIDVTDIKHYVDRVEQNYTREQLLVSCAKVLCLEENLDYAVAAILEQLALFYNADRSYIFELNKTTNELSATHVYIKPKVKPFRNILSSQGQKELQEWLLRFRGQNEANLQIVKKDLTCYPALHDAYLERDIENLLILPLQAGDRFFGIIGLDTVRSNTQDTDLLKTAALFIINNLQKIQTITKLNYLSEIDELTGVYNRNKFNAETYALREKKEPIGIIFIDVNGLKKINDTLGHKKGDELLQRVGNFLKSLFSERIFRIGGDEFVILLKNISRQCFADKIIRLHAALQDERNISLSIGDYYSSEEIIDEVLHKADQIMFEQKRKYYEKIQ